VFLHLPRPFEQIIEQLSKARCWIYRTSSSFLSSEIIIVPWVCFVVRVLSRPSSPTTTSDSYPLVFKLHMSVQSRVTSIVSTTPINCAVELSLPQHLLLFSWLLTRCGRILLCLGFALGFSFSICF
jgi:hypothetical protein